MNSRKIGLLGAGYLGSEIIRIIAPEQLAWQSHMGSGDTNPTPGTIFFNWQEEETWNRIPTEPVTLILTIPPVNKSAEAEKKRLVDWGQWMNSNRPEITDLVYISTTGVYPNRDGVWSESDELEPDNDKGKCRFFSEQALVSYFNLKIIRSGAIYGPERNIGERIIAEKHVPKGDQPIHRIHVHDLARLTLNAVFDPEFPNIVNAVDKMASSSKEVALWLKDQPFFSKKPETIWKPGNFTRKDLPPNAKRIISGERLNKINKFQLKFPTYKEGLTQAFQ